MRRTLLAGVLSVVAFTAAAIASPTVILRVPVNIDNVPADLTRGVLECQLSSVAPFDQAHVISHGRSEFAIEGGRYSGRVGVALVPGGYPLGTDGTIDAHSYRCVLYYSFACTGPSGLPSLCQSGPGGAALPSAPAATAALFATDPARPPHGTIEGTIDRSTAVTLPPFH